MAYDYAYMEGYELQPTKRVALNIKAKPNKRSLNTREFKLGAQTMPTVESALHLGIIRTTSLKDMIKNVEENIKKARNAYGLFGGGYHGNNGLDPDTMSWIIGSLTSFNCSHSRIKCSIVSPSFSQSRHNVFSSFLYIFILLLWRMYAPVNNFNLIGSLWRSPLDLQLIFNIGCSFPFSKFSQLRY
jgi:hypothetical protein